MSAPRVFEIGDVLKFDALTRIVPTSLFYPKHDRNYLVVLVEDLVMSGVKVFRITVRELDPNWNLPKNAPTRFFIQETLETIVAGIPAIGGKVIAKMQHGIDWI